MPTYRLTVGIHGTDHPLVLTSLTQAQLDAILADYRTGKTRVLKDVDATRAHVTYMTRSENDD